MVNGKDERGVSPVLMLRFVEAVRAPAIACGRQDQKSEAQDAALLFRGTLAGKNSIYEICLIYATLLRLDIDEQNLWKSHGSSPPFNTK